MTSNRRAAADSEPKCVSIPNSSTIAEVYAITLEAGAQKGSSQASRVFVHTPFFPPQPAIPDPKYNNREGKCHRKVEPPFWCNCDVYMVLVLAELEKAHTEKGSNKSGRKKDHGQPGNGFHANTVTLRITGDAQAGEGVVGCHPTLGL